MSDETRTPQKDPPEGARDVIERELARQEKKGGKAGDDTGKPDKLRKENE